MRTVTFTFPFWSAKTADDVSSAEAMSTPFPHGCLFEGRLTSDLTGVPSTPSWGDTPACAYEVGKRVKRRKREKERGRLDNIFFKTKKKKVASEVVNEWINLHSVLRK